MINQLYKVGTVVRIGCLAVLLTGAGSSLALPKLQLDVSPGMYDPITQTTVATSNPFNLRALIDGSLGLTRTYYLSAAIVPSTSAGDFGSFSINGTTYSGSSGMEYGVPPLDEAIGDVQTHSIYPTYYAEIGFVINPANTTPAYNVQDGSPGSGLLYYVDFTVDISNLIGQPNSPYAVHFDLYTYDGTGTRIDAFAPFSHDAESGHGITIDNPPPVPDAGSTVILLGLGFMGLGAVRRRFV